MNSFYEIFNNDYAVGPNFYLPIKSFKGYYSSNDESLMLTFTENISISIPKTQSTLLFVSQLCKRHAELSSQDRDALDNGGLMNEVKGIMGRIQGDNNMWLWLYFDHFSDVNHHGIPIPLESIGKVVRMIDSFVFDQYRKYESRLVHLSDSNERMGISLLPTKKKVKLWYQMNNNNNVHSFVLTFDQLLKIKDVLMCYLNIE